jgi:predicted transcriptional regulator
MELKAIDLTTLSVPEIDIKYTQQEIKNILESNSSDYFPITESNKCLGLISKSSLQNNRNRSEFPFDYIIKPDLHIYFDHQIFDILDYFITNQCVVLPVLDENENYMGCINSDSLLNALANTLTYKIPGSVITLEVYVNDYSMSEISNIIESEKTSIVGLIINDENILDNKIEVILKLNNSNIDRVIASLERFEYKIKSYSSGESISNDKLKEHYDALMHYLNV